MPFFISALYFLLKTPQWKMYLFLWIKIGIKCGFCQECLGTMVLSSTLQFLTLNVSNFQVDKVNWFSLISWTTQTERIVWQTMKKSFEKWLWRNEEKAIRFVYKWVDAVAWMEFTHPHMVWVVSRQPSPFSTY